MSSFYQQQYNNNINDFKKINENMSEKIHQNQKIQALFSNNLTSNLTSGISTDKRNAYKNNMINDELNNQNDNIDYLGRAKSQSMLSVDLNRFKINPNDNIKKSNNYNNNNLKYKLDENFETFNMDKDNMASINNSNENIDINNLNNNDINNKEKNNINNVLRDFNPFDIRNFLGEKALKKKFNKNKITLVNNIPPSTSNLQMILYNKKMEELKNRKNPEFLFKDFYQKESRRMIVEFIKIYKQNLSATSFITNEIINPLVLMKEKEEDNGSQYSPNKPLDNNETNSNFFLKKDNNNESLLKSESHISQKLFESTSKNKFKNINSFKILSAFLNDMDDESPEKMSLLTYLTIPRIMRRVVGDEKLSYVFCSSPTKISCTYGIETYIFKWSDCQNFNLIGYFDLINVENCYVNPENKNLFDIVITTGIKKMNSNNDINKDNYYCIETEDEAMAQNYVQAINFVSQLVKYRVYLKQKKEGNFGKY